jgi:Tfp pilus assembly protein PilO
MKLQIRDRDRRALLLCGAAVLVYVVVQFVALPAYDRISAARDLAADKENQVRRYRRAELRKGQYTGLLKLAADRVQKDEAVVIPAASLPLASAEMQSLVEGAGAKVGLMLSQRTISAPRRLNDFYADLPMTLSFESTPGQLVAFLSELRSLSRFISVRTLQVTPVEMVTEIPKGYDLTKNVRVTMTITSLSSSSLVRTQGATR